MGIRAAIFDCYATLVDAEAVSCEPIAALFERRGITTDPAAVLARWRAMKVADVERGLTGAPPPFRTLWSRWQAHGTELLEPFGVAEGGNDWADCRRDAHLVSPVYDDVVPTLTALRAAGLRCAVLSDADADTLLPCLEHNALAFDAVVCSEDVGCYKPHERMFATACTALGVDPAEAVYVGDNPRADVVGARHAGLVSIWLNRDSRAWPAEVERPDHTITSLLELPAILGL